MYAYLGREKWFWKKFLMYKPFYNFFYYCNVLFSCSLFLILHLVSFTSCNTAFTIKCMRIRYLNEMNEFFSNSLHCFVWKSWRYYWCYKIFWLTNYLPFVLKSVNKINEWIREQWWQCSFIQACFVHVLHSQCQLYQFFSLWEMRDDDRSRITISVYLAHDSLHWLGAIWAALSLKAILCTPHVFGL